MLRFQALTMVAAVTIGGVGMVQADIYPTNRCVAAKQKAAGAYCRQSLKAWSVWDRHHDDAARDAAIGRARRRLLGAWSAAEQTAQAAGVDCAVTTLAGAAAEMQITLAIAPIVGAVNSGLDLAREAEKQCGARILTAAGRQCQALLNADSALIKFLAQDPTRQQYGAAQADARSAFAKTFTQATRRACPTTASSAGVSAAVDALAAAIVRDTTVSPNVDDAQYTTISPTGTTNYLGKALTPTCMNSTPYHFFVKRGSVNKLVVYYQGGGACWEQLTCSVPACDTSVNVNGGDNPNVGAPRPGFADLTNAENPFKDWNSVFVSYCSCDIHFGDAAQDYPLHVEHRGFHNARIVEKFAREHFVNPEAIFVSGSSAGAYGAWFHAPLLHEVWPASKFTVLADAGNGVITQSFLELNFPNWNFEGNLPANVPAIQQVFDEGSGIPGYTKVVAGLYPNTTWAHYTTAFDGGSGGQTGFYNIMINDNNPINALTWWRGSCAFTTQMRAQVLATAAAIPDNYRYYIGTGSRHTMFGSNKVYTDTTGGVPTLVDWVNGMLASGNGVADPAWTNVECTNCGRTLSGDPRPNPLEPPFVQNGPDVDIDCNPTPAG
jgi:Pectinacetylesterase